MSLSTLPAESAAAIADWLSKQPVITRRREQALGQPVSREPSQTPVPESIVPVTPRGVQAAVTAQPRRTSLLVKSLQALQSANESRRKTADSTSESQQSAQRQAKPVSVAKSMSADEARESEQIDPLPDFDLGSLLDQDHCVFVGNRARAELADWLPVASASIVGSADPATSPLSEFEVQNQTTRDQQGLAPGKATAQTNAPKSTSGQGMDRRAYPRRDSEGVVTVCRRSVANRLFQRTPNLPWKLHASALKGRLIDVSMTGMALSLPEPLPEGTPVSLQVTSRSLDQPAEVTGHVLRCIPVEANVGEGENHWRLVCQLDNRLTFEQVHSLGKQMFAYTMV